MKTLKKTSVKLEFYKHSPISPYARKTTQRPCKVAQFTPIPRYVITEPDFQCQEKKHWLLYIPQKVCISEFGRSVCREILLIHVFCLILTG